jgi:hypothetical protein
MCATLCLNKPKCSLANYNPTLKTCNLFEGGAGCKPISKSGIQGIYCDCNHELQAGAFFSNTEPYNLAFEEGDECEKISSNGKYYKELAEDATILDCKKECLKTSNCKYVNFNTEEKKSTDAGEISIKKCFMFSGLNCKLTQKSIEVEPASCRDMSNAQTYKPYCYTFNTEIQNCNEKTCFAERFKKCIQTPFCSTYIDEEENAGDAFENTRCMYKCKYISSYTDCSANTHCVWESGSDVCKDACESISDTTADNSVNLPNFPSRCSYFENYFDEQAICIFNPNTKTCKTDCDNYFYAKSQELCLNALDGNKHRCSYLDSGDLLSSTDKDVCYRNCETITTPENCVNNNNCKLKDDNTCVQKCNLLSASGCSRFTTHCKFEDSVCKDII